MPHVFVHVSPGAANAGASRFAGPGRHLRGSPDDGSFKVPPSTTTVFQHGTREKAFERQAAHVFAKFVERQAAESESQITGFAQIR